MYNDIAIKYRKWAERFRWYYYFFSITLKSYAFPKRILDIGCGSGILIEELKKVFPKAEIVGIDSSIEMCRICRKLSECIYGNALFLPFKDDKFDLVVMFFSLHDLDVEKAISEAKRVLRKGGFLAIKDINSVTPEIFKYLMLRVLELNIGKDYSDYLLKIARKFPSPEEIAELIRSEFRIKMFCENIFDFDIIAELH